jgi:pyruvate formate lyase activating enzyme
MSKEPRDAMLWEPEGEGDIVRCRLCGHRCVISPGGFGQCRVRQNLGGKLVSMSYREVVAIHIDPVEKKPLFHFLPGTESLSVATPGCNFRCAFCQNWQISQMPKEDKLYHPVTEHFTPDRIAALAAHHRCRSISYTYTEPTVFYELAYDTAKKARLYGLKNCFVTNGFLSAEAIETISPYLDAANVDLKCFSDDTYQHLLGGRLQPVLDALLAMKKHKIWIELTTLVVPGMNDSRGELRDMANWIAKNLGVETPWHITRFHGDYHMASSRPTPLWSLKEAVEAGRDAGLKYVYSGNVVNGNDERTYCPGCREVVIDRRGFTVEAVRIRHGACPSCGTPIAGVWH